LRRVYYALAPRFNPAAGSRFRDPA